MSDTLRKGDKIRSSWSEDVYLNGGGKVYVSTAIETTVGTASIEWEMGRLKDLMAEAHMSNIEAAKSEEK